MMNTMAGFVAALICLVSVSCQSTATVSKNPKAPEQREPRPLPAWTKAKVDPSRGKGRFVKIRMKIIEVNRETDDATTPKKPYRQRMDDRQKEKFLAELSQRKGADILSAPSVVTEEGQCARIEIGRELAVPTDVGENPEFTIEKTGIANYLRARPSADGRTIRLDVLTEVRELEGFKEVKPGLEHPTFSTRRAGSSVDIANGESILFGGLVDERQQDVEDVALGIFKKRFVETYTRELLVLAEATVVDQNGKVVAAR